MLSKRTEHIGIAQAGGRWHWVHYRPAGFSGYSSQTYQSDIDAALAACEIAWCKGLQVSDEVDALLTNDWQNEPGYAERRG